MNYYIQGNKANADQIKAAFEELGFICTLPDCVFDDEKLIFLTSSGVVYSFYAYQAIYDIIKTHPDYKELELPVEPKFKDGDVLMTTKIRSCPFIYRKTDYNNNLAYYYVGIDGNGNLSIGWPKRTLYHFGSIADAVIAGQGQRELLFKKMKEAGYEWDADKKELRKIKPHYDIKNFKPFDKVLVRGYDTDTWSAEWFSHYVDGEDGTTFVTTCCYCIQCIPFEGNEHLLGTTDMPDEMYINW